MVHFYFSMTATSFDKRGLPRFVTNNTGSASGARTIGVDVDNRNLAAGAQVESIGDLAVDGATNHWAVGVNIDNSGLPAQSCVVGLGANQATAGMVFGADSGGVMVGHNILTNGDQCNGGVYMGCEIRSDPLYTCGTTTNCVMIGNQIGVQTGGASAVLPLSDSVSIGYNCNAFPTSTVIGGGAGLVLSNNWDTARNVFIGHDCARGAVFGNTDVFGGAGNGGHTLIGTDAYQDNLGPMVLGQTVVGGQACALFGGTSCETGIRATVLGFAACQDTVIGDGATVIGFGAAADGTKAPNAGSIGQSATIIGDSALRNYPGAIGDSTTVIGAEALKDITGDLNALCTYVGSQAGAGSDFSGGAGSSSTYIGAKAGKGIDSLNGAANSNTVVGVNGLADNTTTAGLQVIGNVMVGASCGFASEVRQTVALGQGTARDGDFFRCVALGNEAGRLSTDLAYATMVGWNAGRNCTTSDSSSIILGRDCDPPGGPFLAVGKFLTTPAGTGSNTVTHTIPIYYNGTRYNLLART